jgi:WD40 repeat protein/predicted nucleic acid-binding Zn finger protein
LSKIIECLKARSLINSFSTTSNKNLAYCTELHGAKILSTDDCSVKFHFTHEHLNHETTATAFNQEGNLLCFANENIIYIADITKKEIVKKIPTDAKKILLLMFDESSKYIIAGNDNGRVLRYNCSSASVQERLCSFGYNETDRSKTLKNYVSAFAMINNRLASTGLGGEIVVLDMHTRANKTTLQNSRSRINALHFVDEDTLISANYDGLITVFSIKQKKVLKEIQTPLNRVNKIIAMADPNYIMLSSNANFVSIVDIKNYKLLHHKYQEFEDIVLNITPVDKRTVAIALKSGKIQKIELATKEDLSSLIVHNSIDAAYELADAEPMLKSTIEYEDLENIYYKMYKQAITALINQKISLANEHLKMFKELKSKKKDVNSLFLAFKNYNNLKVLFANKKFNLAYALVARYPELKQTPIYRKLEELWRYDFKNAQREMLKTNKEKAIFILQRYKTIPAKKELINLVINQNEDFVGFAVALKEKDYAQASKIAAKNKLLKMAPSYSLLQNELEYKQQQIKNFIYLGDVDKAKIAISFIENIEHLKEIVEKFYKECEHLELLQAFYEKSNFKKCYEVLDNYPSLGNTQLAELLERHWANLMQKCEAYATKGSATSIKSTLGELATLEGRLDKIGDLFRLSFHVNIKSFLSKGSLEKMEKAIYSYIDIFGLDYEIKELMKLYEQKTKHKLAITHEATQSRNSWVNSNFI